MEGQVAQKIKNLYTKLGATQDPQRLKSLKTQAERLEALHNSIVSDIKTVEAQYQPAYTAQLYNVFEKSYYVTGYGLEQAARIAAHVPIISPTQVLGVLANPWLSDGANYSVRLRANTADLADKMRDIVAQAVANGHEWNKTARMIASAANEGYFNAVRLARTELTRASAMGASYLYMQNADILDGKRWNATLDARTAPKDAANDVKLYDLTTIPRKAGACQGSVYQITHTVGAYGPRHLAPWARITANGLAGRVTVPKPGARANLHRPRPTKNTQNCGGCLPCPKDWPTITLKAIYGQGKRLRT
jgi:uncharacterized protein (UPF0335 family)